MNNIIKSYRTILYNAFVGLFIVQIVTSCTNQTPNLQLESGKNLIGLVSTINLEPDGKGVLLADYFINTVTENTDSNTSLAYNLIVI